MPQKREWREEEFLLVLYSPDLSDEEMARRVNRHLLEEVQVVRQGIHNFHSGQEAPSLKPMMRRRLKRKDLPAVCSVCGEEF